LNIGNKKDKKIKRTKGKGQRAKKLKSQHPIFFGHRMHTMEFKTGSYNTRLILNPTDIILRFEHSDTHRVYERTFFERDFVDYVILGGLEFVGKVLRSGLPFPIQNITESTSELNITIPFTHEFIPKPLNLQFRIPSIRREKGGADIEDMSTRLKKMEEAMNLCKTLSTRIEELEQRCGDTITLAGCDYAIPISVTHLILVKNNSMLPDGRRFSSWYTGMYHRHNHGWGEYNLLRPCNHPNEGDNPGWAVLPQEEKVYTFNAFLSLKNLKYMKNLTQLTICGSSECTNYESIGEIGRLQELKIVSNMQSQQCGSPPQWQYTPKDSQPNLQNISWISNLKNLKTVSFQGCATLSEISAIKELPNLTELNVKNTSVKNTAFLANPKLTIHTA